VRFTAAERVRIGDTPVHVTRLGLGGAPAGNLYRPVPDTVVAATVRRCLELGVTWVDTAPHYGLGRSERRLGAAVRGRDDVTVSTKVGRLLEPHPDGPPPDADAASLPADQLDDEGFAVPRSHRRRWDFSREGIRRSLDESRERLGRDRLDVALLHDPDRHMPTAMGSGLDALVAARASGEVGAIGAGMNHSEPLTRLVRTGRLDVVMLAGRYTLLEQPALEELMPAAAATGTAVVAVGIFNSGLLARDEVPDDATYDYVPAPPAVINRARRIAATCREFAVPLPAAALHVPLAHPQVVAVAVGMARPEHVDAAVRWLETPIPPELWEALRGRGLLPDAVPTPDRP
jgi:D-threo-aldose 1-dehydrogenase